MTTPPAKRENLFVNLIFNIALPSLVLSKLSKPEYLGPVWGLVVALAFPIGYGLWDFAQRRKTNPVSIIGFVSVLATGGLGLMKVSLFWFAVKEAAVPGVLALAVLISMRTSRPLIRSLLYNDQIIDVERVDAALAANGRRAEFERMLAHASLWMVASFIISSVLNYVMARVLLVSPVGSVEFNAELAKMNWWSWPIIVVPSTAMMMFALWRLMAGIKTLTGLDMEALLRAETGGKPATPASPPSGA